MNQTYPITEQEWKDQERDLELQSVSREEREMRDGLEDTRKREDRDRGKIRGHGAQNIPR